MEILFTEPRWVALPAAHPLAKRDVILFRELWHEPFVAAPAETGSWRDWWLAAGELEVPVRLAIEERTGRVEAARTSSAGLNSQLAVAHATVSG